MKAFLYVCGGLFFCVVLVIGCMAINAAGWFASQTATVVQQQFDPVEMQKKYELFKDEAAQLDAKLADIAIKQQQLTRERAIPNPDRTDREELMIHEQEFSGIKYSYNQLAADYNSQMSKWNYRFCNVGTLPQGATTPLPREYKPYIED